MIKNNFLLITLNYIDIINSLLIIILTTFLIIITKIEGFTGKPKIYLKLVLLFLLILLLTDELFYLKIFNEILILFPLQNFFYLSLIPLVYVYSRDLVFNGRDKSRPKLYVFLIVPVLVGLTSFSVLLNLSEAERLLFYQNYLYENNDTIPLYNFLRSFVGVIYYVQFSFYFILQIKLILDVRKEFKGEAKELSLMNYMIIYVVGIFIYEILILIINLWLFDEKYLIKTFELLATFGFILLGIYVTFNQTLILIQIRINRIAIKLEDSNNKIYEKITISDEEKIAIKDALEEILYSKKIYLDPNLSLKSLSRKIHVQERKVSIVINHVLKKNFHHYINEFRIKEAIELMKARENINIEDLFLKVGFNSRSTFNRVFKEITGKTPSEYLAEISEQSEIE